MYSESVPAVYALSPVVSATVGLIDSTRLAVTFALPPASPPEMSPAIVTIGSLLGVGLGMGVAVGVAVGTGSDASTTRYGWLLAESRLAKQTSADCDVVTAM